MLFQIQDLKKLKRIVLRLRLLPNIYSHLHNNSYNIDLTSNVRVHIRQGECSNYYKNGILNQKAYYIDDKLDHYIECRNDKGEIIDCEREKEVLSKAREGIYIKKFHKF